MIVNLPDRWSGAMNKASARRGRDWAEVLLAAPDTGARFGLDGRATNGVNAKPPGMIRDIKARGRAGH